MIQLQENSRSIRNKHWQVTGKNAISCTQHTKYLCVYYVIDLKSPMLQIFNWFNVIFFFFFSSLFPVLIALFSLINSAQSLKIKYNKLIIVKWLWCCCYFIIFFFLQNSHSAKSNDYLYLIHFRSQSWMVGLSCVFCVHIFQPLLMLLI